MTEDWHLPLRQVLDDWRAQAGQPDEKTLFALALAATAGALAAGAIQSKARVNQHPEALIRLAQLAAPSRPRQIEANRIIDELRISGPELLRYCRILSVRPPLCATRYGNRSDWVLSRLEAPPVRAPTLAELEGIAKLRKEELARWQAWRERPLPPVPKSLSSVPAATVRPHRSGTSERGGLPQIEQSASGSSTSSKTDTLPPKRRGGRTKGSGYQRIDAPLLREMHELIETGQATGALDAARQIAHKARAASTEAAVERLRKKYPESYGENVKPIDP